ncbi:MAG: transketolase [Brachymonas sp.]|nr:transketolase [Brachymonas sp.]
MTPAQSTLMANAIRVLSIDAVEQAKSGHPGAPMGMADMAVALWGRHLRHNPANPQWINRDRFVLSNGHASMLQYALLHFTGYDLPMDEIKRFRQLGSKTAGHPEVGLTPGVETTTGPLGQGLANAVGMALAEKLLAAEFNRPGFDVVDHHTYVMLGDGCLMEGISHEACALAGAWKLNKLVALYDDNGISIDGQVQPWFADDTAKRFEAYQWNVIGPIDGHDANAVDQALAQAKQSATQPTLIICKTHIGKGSPNRADTAKAHGEPLGAEEIALVRKELGWPHAPFEMPQEVYRAWDAKAQGAQDEAEWETLYAAYMKQFPLLAAELRRRMNGAVSPMVEQLAERMPRVYQPHAPAAATRKASQMALESFTAHMPELLGGSADLTGSNLTMTQNTPPLRFADDGSVVKVDDGFVVLTDKSRHSESAKPGRHINYGVREFGMAAIMNGIALHGGYIPYGGTFLTFSDYSRNAIRMAALMKLRVIHVFTHDSIGLGEDGPTHQSIEHAASLRLIPNLDVWRPCDVVEAAIAWATALQNDKRPSAMLLSRQNVPYMHKDDASLIARGAYVLAGPSRAGLSKAAQAVIIATGSEVQLAMQAQELLAQRGVAVRVVSMPSTTVFDRQTPEYKQAVLPPELPRIAVEMGSSDFWWKYGCAAVVGIDTFGESAPAKDLFAHFGFTPENVAATVEAVLASA